jgi:hypothetical protein
MKRLMMSLIAGSVLALAGCGGGGDSSTSGGGGGGGGGGTPPAKISEANARQVAADSIGVLQFVFDSSADYQGLLEAFSSFGGQGAGVATSGSSVKSISTALAQVREARALMQDSAVGVDLGTFDCVDGGTLRVDFVDVAPEEVVSAGDQFTIVYTNCSQFGTVQNGAFGATINAASPTSVSITLSFSNYSFSDPQEGTFLSNGAITISVNESSPGQIDLAITSSFLESSDSSGTTTLSNFSATAQINENSGTFSYSVSGTISDGVFTATIATPVPFTGTLGEDGVVTAGKLIVTADDGSVLEIEVVGPNQVKVTANGQSQIYTWDELANE